MVYGLSGQRMLIALLIGVILLIIMVLKTKLPAFLALIITTVLLGLIGGMPLLNVTLEDGRTIGIINSLWQHRDHHRAGRHDGTALRGYGCGQKDGLYLP